MQALGYYEADAVSSRSSVHFQKPTRRITPCSLSEVLWIESSTSAVKFVMSLDSLKYSKTFSVGIAEGAMFEVDCHCKE